MSIPWVEKYRPKTLRDVIGNPEIIDRLIEISKTGNMPNLVISGPPGCGKTTSVWALARDMLGEKVKDACLELNASDERGIDVVRDRIKRFASTKVTLPENAHKIVILDEADSMTEGAQQALRRIMEVFSSTTRFAFACNQSDKIIEPLQSRCAIIKFGKLTDEQIMERLVFVCNKEEVQYNPGGITAILYTAQGDMRQALNNIQCTAAGYGTITKDYVYRVCDEPHPEKMYQIFDCCINGRTQEAFDLIDGLYCLGYSVDDLVGVMFKTSGVATRIQLAGLVSRLSQVKNKLEMEN